MSTQVRNFLEEVEGGRKGASSSQPGRGAGLQEGRVDKENKENKEQGERADRLQKEVDRWKSEAARYTPVGHSSHAQQFLLQVQTRA